jgi:hypothetical protein
MPGTEHTPKHASPAPIEYGATWGGDLYQDVQVPSGSWCKIRRNMDPIELMTSDDPAAEQHDILGAIVRKKIQEAGQRVAAGDQPIIQQAVDNVDDVLESMRGNSKVGSMVNSFVVKLVVKPELQFPPADPADRVSGVVYVDTVPFNDRIFLFDLAMQGTAKAGRFPAVVEDDLESVGDGEDVPNQA